jgi:hypothetical protein
MGLPSGSLWSVTVRNTTLPATGPTIDFEESNGSYGYVISEVAGYLAHPPRDGFRVQGANLVVPVTFVPIRSSWRVTWEESGLWTGMNWSVLVNGSTITGSRAWLSASLRNGTYTFSITNSRDFVPQPRTGSVRVQGSAAVITVAFRQAKFSVVFAAQGLPSGLVWGVRLSHDEAQVSSLTETFQEANGSYTFNVTAPSGYYPVPSHGNLTVRPGGVQLVIIFHRNGPAPIPSVWFLGSRAAAVAIVLGVAAWGGFALIGAIHRRESRQGPRP